MPLAGNLEHRASARSAAAAIARCALAALALSLALSLPAPAAPAEASATSPMAVPAARQAASVAVITIHEPIDNWTAHSVERRIREAERMGADAIVLDIDTPGGALGATLEIVTRIENAAIPNTVAWINPQAYSAGAIIALACREVVVQKYSQTGDALPIDVQSLLTTGGMREAERQKVLAPLLARLVDAARRNGYDEKLVQGFVTLGVELWLVENVETGQRLFIDEGEWAMLFDGPPPRPAARVASGAVTGQGRAKLPKAPPAPDAEQAPLIGKPAATPGGEFQSASPILGRGLIAELNQRLTVPSRRPVLSPADAGRWRYVEYVSDGAAPLVLGAEEMLDFGLAAAVVQNDEQLRQFFAASTLTRMDMSWSERFVRFMTSRPVQIVLIAVFLIALFVEMAAPGIGVPGAIAGLALVGLLAPQFMIGAASWWGVAAIVLGLGLIALELFVLPGFGVAGVAGVFSLFAGLVGVIMAPGTTPGESSGELLWGAATVLMAFFTAGVGIYFVARHYGSLPIFNRLILTSEPRDDDPTMLEAMAAAPAAGPVAVGDEGVAVTPLRPAGTAQFGDALVDVVCEIGFAEKGAPVRVVEVSGYRVAVQRMDGAADGPPAPTDAPDRGAMA